MIHVHCRSADIKEFAPKCILFPEGNIYYSHKSHPSFLSFTCNTNNFVVKTEGGDDDMLQLSTVKRELKFDPVMVGGDTTSSQKTTGRNGDEGQFRTKNDDEGNVRSEEVEVLKIELTSNPSLL